MRKGNNTLFWASSLALASAALIFVARQHLGHILINEKHILTSAEFGTISGWAFKGTAVALLLVSFFLDWVGIKRVMLIACLTQILGILGFVATSDATVMLISMTLAGFGWGLIEVAINPLCAVQYPENKTERLNLLHAWWPGGLILGGLVCKYLLDVLGLPWQAYMLIMIIPVLTYGIMIVKREFPASERAEAGISNKEMLKTVATPGFLLLLFCMSLTASAELGPGQWLETVFREYANASGTMILVYGSAIMFVLRFFMGPIRKVINPIGIISISCALAAIGLYGLSSAAATQNIFLIYGAATIFYLGVCFIWPTMYAIAAELFPKGGGLTIGLIGAVGMAGVSIWIPRIGMLGDTYGLTGAFKIVSILPVIVFIIFISWWLKMKTTGGYNAVNLVKEMQESQTA